MGKDKEVNLNEIDENFIISSFKNKERRNNPSSEPRPLLPPEKTDNPEKGIITEAKEAAPVTQIENYKEESRRKRSKSPDYEELFLVDSGIPTRSGKLVSVREKYHKRIAKIVKEIGENNVSIFSYIDNVLSHHFDVFQDEIAELYNKNKDDDDDYLTLKK